MNHNHTPAETEAEIIARLKRERLSDGWQASVNLADVGQGLGYYSLYDGVALRGYGVAESMAAALARLTRDEQPKRPLYFWRPGVSVVGGSVGR